jgi:catechol 2,3-dioxygenase-like lactoylglutathione lyase family enzyme
MRSIIKVITFCLILLFSIQVDAKLGFVGIGVSNIEKSTKFYQDILGLDVIGTYDDVTVDNADGSESFLDEVVLGYNDKPGTLLVLMNWPNDDKKYDGDNTKIVFEVEDAKAVIEKIRKAGGKIDREATPHYTIEGGLVGLGRDPDNYVVEVIQWQVK